VTDAELRAAHSTVSPATTRKRWRLAGATSTPSVPTTASSMFAESKARTRASARPRAKALASAELMSMPRAGGDHGAGHDPAREQTSGRAPSIITSPVLRLTRPAIAPGAAETAPRVPRGRARWPAVHLRDRP
jgi:hypothetical protein